MAAVPAVLTRITEIQASIAGVVRAFDGNTPPESVEDTPCFVNLFAEAEDARIDYHISYERHVYSVTMLLLLTRQDLPEAYSRAVPFIELTRAAFRANVTLGGRVGHCWIDRYRVTEIQIAGETFLGVRFVLMVQVSEPVEAAAGT